MNLIICYTPLHALIVEKLIRDNHISEYYVLYICFADNKKHRHYYEKIKGNCESDFLIMSHKSLKDFKSLLSWKRKLPKSLQFNHLFCGNVKHVYSRFIAYLIGVKRFSTYDDGSGNISRAGYLYELKEHSLSNVFFRMLSPHYLYKNVIEKIETHFTIYSVPNVYSSYAQSFIKTSLFDHGDFGEDFEESKITVYLGNAFAEDDELSRKEEDQMDNQIIQKFDVDIYLPHPRREDLSSLNLRGASINESPSISEETILNLLKRYKEVIVLGCYSTTLINLLSIDRLKLINVHANLKKPTCGLLDLFNSMGIETTHIS